MLTNEAIEAHLSYLRPAVEALGHKLDQVSRKIDAGLSPLVEKPNDTFDEMAKNRDQNRQELNECTSRILATVDEIKLSVCIGAILASGASIAHSLGWI